MTTQNLIAQLKNVSLKYDQTRALDQVTLDIPKGIVVGVIGPDGVGKSSLLALLSGARIIQTGEVIVFDGPMNLKKHRDKICPQISYMPQGLGKNLYPTLSVFENVDFFARLFNQNKKERTARINHLLKVTGLLPFSDRPAGKLSGGMKQKLGLCCSLIHNPELLILDEPTTGVDPLSRRQFWELITNLKKDHPSMSVIVATAYMEEAASFDWLVMMNAGKVLAKGALAELLTKTETINLEEAYLSLLSQEELINLKQYNRSTPFDYEEKEVLIEAHDLTMTFGDFTAVNKVNFKISRGEIYGFLGSNGCGKTTTMKMLTGLLTATSGEAFLFGKPVTSSGNEAKMRVGFMSQAFSLYPELTVEQNLILHARLFAIPDEQIVSRVEELATRFDLLKVKNRLPQTIPLGVRQRLQLATALIHKPEILILDEPTSGVDPIARNDFWQQMLKLSRNENVTIFVSTHFMNEAERCDKIALMHAGRVLETGTPAEIKNNYHTESLETAFVECLQKAGAGIEENQNDNDSTLNFDSHPSHIRKSLFSLRRMLSYTHRETLELKRDPIRLSIALVGSVILLIVMGLGITMDIENLSFSVLDQDQSTLSRDYIQNLSGSRYFSKKQSIYSMSEINNQMKKGELGMILTIPANFEQDVLRGNHTEISAFIDGAFPTRADTIIGYAQGMHQLWLTGLAQKTQNTAQASIPANIEIRYRYNPEVKSLVSIVPSVIPILLIFIPAILTALSVVREKEMGSIINLYVTPVTRLEFMLGKQLPYIILASMSFILLSILATLIFRVPIKGNYLLLLFAAIIYVCSSTGLGLLMSSFTKNQTAALFGTSLLTMIPAVQYSGLIDPVSSMQGIGKFIGSVYPTTHFLTISQGIFSKGLQFKDLYISYIALIITAPIIIGIGTLLLKKQEK